MYARWFKRVIDISVASMALLMLLPLYVFIALCIKLDSKGPILFRQLRTGLDGKAFTMMKFRSMAASNNVLDPTKKDRITFVGKILRVTSLDEIPQLFNVLRGDMSFIGPRPWIVLYYECMDTAQRKRNNVRPGITGLAQAHGRNNLSIHEKIAYDLEYVDNISAVEDIKVIFVTIKTLFDAGAHELGKGGIHDELDTLRSQIRTKG